MFENYETSEECSRAYWRAHNAYLSHALDYENLPDYISFLYNLSEAENADYVVESLRFKSNRTLEELKREYEGRKNGLTAIAI